MAAMANKNKKECCARPGMGGRAKLYSARGRPRKNKIEAKEEKDEEEEDGEKPPETKMQEDAPQSNGEQKTTEDTGGCIYS